jgi:RND superfamily putative drug exporter
MSVEVSTSERPLPRTHVTVGPVPWQSRFRFFVIGAWLLLVVIAAPFAAQEQSHLTGGGFDAPGSEAAIVSSALHKQYPNINESPLALVLVPAAGASQTDMLDAIGQVARSIDGIDGVSINPQARAQVEMLAQASPSRTLVLPLDAKLSDTQTIDAAAQLRQRLDIQDEQGGLLAGGRVTVHAAGQGALWAGFQSLSTKAANQAEERGLPIIAIILLLVFGSIGASVLPLGLGAASVVIAGAAVFGLSLFGEISVFAPQVTSMIGLGVAVDYSLFVLLRYRESIDAGETADEAISTALNTSGRAVVFSGLTVVLSLATLFRIPNAAMRSLALGAITVVIVAVLAAVTLLPALLRVIGHRHLRPGWVHAVLNRFRPASASTRTRTSFWARWAAAVMRRPVLSAVGSALVLGILAIPALDLQMRNYASAQLPASSEVLQGRRAAVDALGPGALGPAYVLVQFSSGTASTPANHTSVDAVASALGQDPLVKVVAPVEVATDAHSAIIPAILTVDPESDQAREHLKTLRQTLPRAAGATATVAVGGVTANLVDFDELISSSLPSIMALILALAFVVLFVLLRSIVLPLKAILMNLLSVAAAYGTLVAVFEWGWLKFLGLPQASAVDTITPALVLAIAFGLSMDYEVFLLSRIRERYEATGDTSRAVAEALSTSAATISSAALIMVAVFLAFVSAGIPSIQRIGFALAVVIALDATLVRLVLVPAAMKLLGDWNWWLPGPIARRLEPVAHRLGHTA